MNKSELAAQIADKARITKKDADVVLNAVIDSISDALAKGEKVQVIGFGAFEVRQRKERQGRNPRKPGEKMIIPATKSPVFKAGKVLKDTVNK